MEDGSDDDSFFSIDITRNFSLEDIYKAVMEDKEDDITSFGNLGFELDEGNFPENCTSSTPIVMRDCQVEEEPETSRDIDDISSIDDSQDDKEIIDNKSDSSSSASGDYDVRPISSEEELESNSELNMEVNGINGEVSDEKTPEPDICNTLPENENSPDNSRDINRDESDKALEASDENQSESGDNVIENTSHNESAPVGTSVSLISVGDKAEGDNVKVTLTENYETLPLQTSTQEDRVREIQSTENKVSQGGASDGKHEIGTKPLVANGISTIAYHDALEEKIISVSYDSATQEETILVFSQPKPNTIATMNGKQSIGHIEKDSARNEKGTVYENFTNILKYRGILSLLVIFFCVSLAAFIMSLYAIANRCNYPNIKARESQLLTLMQQNSCPVGWRRYNGSCYGLVTSSKMNYSDAKELCNQHSADLVTLQTKEENTFFTKTILCPRATYLGRNNPVYIGLRKVNVGLNRSNSYEYKWNEKERLSFTNFNGTINSRYSCVQMSKEGTWAEVSCSTKMNFYCEQDTFLDDTC